MVEIHNQAWPSFGRCVTSLCLPLISKSRANLCPHLFSTGGLAIAGERECVGFPRDTAVLLRMGPAGSQARWQKEAAMSPVPATPQSYCYRSKSVGLAKTAAD